MSRFPYPGGDNRYKACISHRAQVGAVGPSRFGPLAPSSYPHRSASSGTKKGRQDALVPAAPQPTR